jgi:alpha-L-fucosidase 2
LLISPFQTFACAHWQQLIWELFDHIIRDWGASGDKDEAFLQSVKKAYHSMDNGVHVGSWGQIKGIQIFHNTGKVRYICLGHILILNTEWKLEEDQKNDNHRHLSELYGWYPGYAISGVHGNNKTITDAVIASLNSRGDGKADANTGWGKVWRSACWAALNNTDQALVPTPHTLSPQFPIYATLYLTFVSGEQLQAAQVQH